MQTIAEFLKKYPVKMETKSSFHNPHMEENPKYPMDHWQCKLSYQGRQMIVYFSKGMGLRRRMAHGDVPVPPSVNEILNCLASDISGVDQAFESWASDYGYDEDSRKAKKIYRAVLMQTAKLQRLLGYNEFIELRDDTERM